MPIVIYLAIIYFSLIYFFLIYFFLIYSQKKTHRERDGLKLSIYYLNLYKKQL